MIFETDTLSGQENYRLLVGGITPRPIAWISTLSATGVANLAPYSFFTVASCNPPVLSVTQGTPRTGGDKDTLTNLLATKECVVHIVSAPLLEPMNQTCAALPPDHSEIDFAQLSTQPSMSVAPPSVADSEVRYECRLREVVRISSLPAGGSLVLLDVVAVYVSDRIFVEGQIDQTLLDSLGKMGGDYYTRTNDLLEKSRPE